MWVDAVSCKSSTCSPHRHCFSRKSRELHASTLLRCFPAKQAQGVLQAGDEASTDRQPVTLTFGLPICTFFRPFVLSVIAPPGAVPAMVHKIYLRKSKNNGNPPGIRNFFRICGSPRCYLMQAFRALCFCGQAGGDMHALIDCLAPKPSPMNRHSAQR